MAEVAKDSETGGLDIVFRLEMMGGARNDCRGSRGPG